MNTYRLGSSPLVSAPGLIAWAINGYHFPKDQKTILNVITATWEGIPETAATLLLSKIVPYTIDGDAVVFTA